MYKQIAKLVLYRDLLSDGVISRMARIIGDFEGGYRSSDISKEELVGRINAEVSELLSFAVRYGFSGNLWYNYLAYLVAMDENAFSLACEKSEVVEGTLVSFARTDFKIIGALFDYNFARLERELGISSFSMIADYVPSGRASHVDEDLAAKVRELSGKLAVAKDEEEFLSAVKAFYGKYGVGKLGLHRAFRVREGAHGIHFVPITNMEDVEFSDLVGYERQKERLIDNTRAFVSGRRANNCLLYGDAGTGKSSSIKAVLNKF